MCASIKADSKSNKERYVVQVESQVNIRRIEPLYAKKSPILTIILLPNSQTQQGFIIGIIGFRVLFRPSKEFRMFTFFDNSGVDGRKTSYACQKEYLEGKIHCSYLDASCVVS